MIDHSAHDPVLNVARARASALREWLEASEGEPVRMIETHISWVLLARTTAYKLKKPVRLPFLDFTTLAARRRFCEEEVRLNRRLAPSLYRDVVEVHEGPEGPRFGGVGQVLEVAVRMRRFPDGALWSEMLAVGALAPCHIDAMAQRLSDFHGDAEVALLESGFGTAEVQESATRRILDACETRRGERAPWAEVVDWMALRAWVEGQLQALAPLWEHRRRDGRVRECHGDLHLANVVQLGNEATAFDAIEFDAALRWIDVLDDIAFLAMDLLVHDQRGLAFRFVDACLVASGDYEGLPALRFYLVRRALVRAQVIGIGEAQGSWPASSCGAARYVALAVELADSADARLAITHGLPGSGKSFLAQGVLEAVGAIRVRSDVERKRLFGLRALQSSLDRVPGGIYDEVTNARTYARLRAVADVSLGAGWPIVVDAAFLHRSERAQFAELAASRSVPFSIFDCQADLPLLRRRLAQRQARGGDASEADATVLGKLSAAEEPLDPDERTVQIVAEEPRIAAQRWLGACHPPRS
jgi:uncharacterized protein